jgi:hypothetical protein
MSSLRHAPPRPARARVAPAYPRALAVGAILLAGCHGLVEGDGSSDPTTRPPTEERRPPTTPEPMGGAPAPYYEEDAGQDADADAQPSTPNPAGDIACPYDGGTCIPPPPVPDPPSGGGMPAPFDAGDPPE